MAAAGGAYGYTPLQAKASCPETACSLDPLPLSTLSAEDDVRALSRRVLEEDRRSPLSEAVQAMVQEREEIETKESDLEKEIEDFDALWKSRRRPLEMEIAACGERKQELGRLIEVAMAAELDYEVPPGPKSLRWVDGTWFSAACNIVVVLNLTSMLLGPKFPEFAKLLKVLDHVFMVWYVLELSIKFALHQRKLLFGKLSVVWWNWLDLTIVVSGIIDMWLMPLITMLAGGTHDHRAPSLTVLRTLRLCRLFRILRFLRLLKAFLKSDLAWADSTTFQAGMSGVIALNAIVMSLELDYPGPAWTWVENAFLLIYTFELAIRQKREGLAFYYSLDNIAWNYLDVVIVGGGIVDLWLTPLLYWFRTVVLGQELSAHQGGASNLTSLLKMMRILRVLRLVRLVKAIRPLYRLLLGVVESLKAMQWVVVLTLLMLYAGAIFWTSLVGKGVLYQGKTPKEVVEVFGTVPRSLFSLFRLMNGDTDVVDAVTTTVMGQLLFVSFMVLANWAILAILTSVVSDNMISASTKAQEEEDRVQKQSDHDARRARLLTLFKEIDSDKSGAINSEEWKLMCQDKGLMHELCDATMLEPRDLEELFKYLAVDTDHADKHSARIGAPMPDPALKSQARKSNRFQGGGDERILHYQDLIDHLRFDGDPADRRSILRLLSRMQAMEQMIEKRFENLEKGCSEMNGAVNNVVSWLMGDGSSASPTNTTSYCHGPAVPAEHHLPRMPQACRMRKQSPAPEPG